MPRCQKRRCVLLGAAAAALMLLALSANVREREEQGGNGRERQRTRLGRRGQVELCVEAQMLSCSRREEEKEAETGEEHSAQH